MGPAQKCLHASPCLVRHPVFVTTLTLFVPTDHDVGQFGRAAWSLGPGHCPAAVLCRTGQDLGDQRLQPPKRRKVRRAYWGRIASPFDAPVPVNAAGRVYGEPALPRSIWRPLPRETKRAGFGLQNSQRDSGEGQGDAVMARRDQGVFILTDHAGRERVSWVDVVALTHQRLRPPVGAFS